MAEEQQAVGLCGTEVKGDWSSFLATPVREADVGSRCVEADRIKGSHILTAEGQVTMYGYFGVSQFSQARKLQPELVIGIDHLEESK